ncbi:DUF4126 domain-containing protein [Sphingomonas morindae]|uniref:DUF4126 domain-containing protein n=1 Tax=Sphingomonas morindae TaxID=1541170 RepID=A0ABY4XCW5_9SPHN|nr:DUF4126 domain-containing protein [Sphingomonas morindae]USI74815.1 DUF4126 domain-containing protein [Sphingomonas morindae]
MIRSLLIGALAGARALTPLAAVAQAARRGALPLDHGGPALLARGPFAWGALALAAGELAGDKLRDAPDRVIAPGLAARMTTAALAGAALAPRRQRGPAALASAATALGAAWLTWRLRQAAMRRFGQGVTGLIEDGLTVAGSALLVRSARRL